MLWWIGLAHAGGTLVVDVEGPCVVIVNLVPRPTGGEDVVVPIDTSRTGRQNVTIRNLLGQTAWSGKVDVPDGHRVVAQWSRGSMTLSPPEPQEAAAAPTPAPPRPSPTPASKPALKPNEVKPYEDVFLSAVEDAGRQGAAAPQVLLNNPDGGRMDVAIGEMVVRLRGEPQKAVLLPVGAHAVVVRDEAGLTLWTGTLSVHADFVVALTLSRLAAPASPNRPDAWRAAP